MSIFDKDMDREVARDLADYERKRRREISSCHKCGAEDPIRLGVEGCDECYNGWPRCSLCNRWLDLKGILAVESNDGICAPCAKRWLLNLPA
jgi:hypothetical protein